MSSTMDLYPGYPIGSVFDGSARQRGQGPVLDQGTVPDGGRPGDPAVGVEFQGGEATQHLGAADLPLVATALFAVFVRKAPMLSRPTTWTCAVTSSKTPSYANNWAAAAPSPRAG